MSEAVNLSENKIPIAYRKLAIRDANNQLAEKISKKYKLRPVVSRILAARGFEPGEVLENFLEPTLKSGLPDPKKLKNLKLACELIDDSFKEKHSVAICCDFDVDGLSGGSLLHSFLTDAGLTCKVFVPDRFKDGYGLNENMVRTISDQGFKLLICVDYGTTNSTELTLATELGLKTIVVDHHHVGDHEVTADVFVNPQQSDCDFADGILCAAGLCWYLTIGLKMYCSFVSKLDPRQYLDLAALGTICDMVPLKGVNRVIAKRGLEMLGHTKRVGLQSLKNVCGIKNEVSGGHVGFGIGPRINAAGRMLNGDLVIELLTTSDSKKANTLAQQLNKLNLKRQDTEALVKESAIQQVNELQKLPWGIVCYGEDFHTGVIGIVAQRIVETYYRPTAVLGLENGIYKGSVRGIKGFSVVKTLENLSSLLIKYGGHEGAGGFSIQPENLATFIKAFNAECKLSLGNLELQPLALADTEAKLSEIDLELVEELKTFAPFGIGNPTPLIMLKDLKVKSVQTLKNAHLKVLLSNGNITVTGIMWRKKSHPAFSVGARVRIVCKPEVNLFNGFKNIQLNIQGCEKH